MSVYNKLEGINIYLNLSFKESIIIDLYYLSNVRCSQMSD